MVEWEVLEQYYPFNDFVNALFPMVIATAPEDFVGRVVRYPQRRDLHLEKAIEKIKRVPDYVWVRASWASIVLRLHNLGYMPERVRQAA
jgi:hypothetical protein